MSKSREPGDKPAKTKKAKPAGKPKASAPAAPQAKSPLAAKSRLEIKSPPEGKSPPAGRPAPESKPAASKAPLPSLPASKAAAAAAKPRAAASPAVKPVAPKPSEPPVKAPEAPPPAKAPVALEPPAAVAKPQRSVPAEPKAAEPKPAAAAPARAAEANPADPKPAAPQPSSAKPATPPQPAAPQPAAPPAAAPQPTAPPPAAAKGRDWSDTLYLPKTDFPMKAGLPDLEPRLLQRWQDIDLYGRLRSAGHGRPRFVLHDGPPYANGNIHIGHALNKILKDLVTKSQTMLGHDSNYVPGWDCHGLPIEWKVEESYRARGAEKPNFSDPVAINAFRAECREFAARWIDVQREEFKRLGVVGDWSQPYTTMSFPAEAAIARELMQFAMNGSLYRGSKPVMWSVVEQTALAEAEVEYQDYQSDTIWVKFKIVQDTEWGDEQQLRRADQACLKPELIDASVVIWTTTPWTIPGNRAISFSSRIGYGLYEVTAAPEGNWAKTGDRFVLADKLAADVMKAAKVEAFERREAVTADELSRVACAHPLRSLGYAFDVPLLDGDHVTDDTGTGFVHTAPGHGTDDYHVWMARQADLHRRGIDTTIPFTVGADGVLTKEAPGLEGKRVLEENGDKGDANDAVIKALAEAGALIARGRLKHQYPHSWRSKKPVIFRNTPQWFVAMDKPLAGKGGNASLRELALSAIERTEWVPASGQNRINGMVSGRPDWVLSRQRAWGVPITVFVHKDTGEVIPNGSRLREEMSPKLIERITSAFAEHGADVWFEAGARERFLTGFVKDPAEWEQATDILDVWFDSGSTHAFTLEDAKAFPGLAGIRRKPDGGVVPEARGQSVPEARGQSVPEARGQSVPEARAEYDRVMYLEGSDQHRGWFQSSLLESCGTRGRAPFDVVLTHGFVLDEKGQKMSKSLGNVVAPQDVMSKSGADILRLWVAASDYSDDLRIGPDILKNFVETYRKLRNSLRWMLGALGHFEEQDRVTVALMKARGLELELLMLHRLAELGEEIPKLYAEYNYRTVLGRLTHFMNTELSAFYFDIRKDALYCDAPSSTRRLAALTVIDQIFRSSCLWLAPILSFTAEEAWLARYPSADSSVHLAAFPEIPADWRDDALAGKWEQVRAVRRVVTGALEIERAAKRIGSSLEAAPRVFIADPALRPALTGVDLAEICITSAIEVVDGDAPEGAFTLPDVKGVGVVPSRAEGRKCARSWRITQDVGADPDYPDLSARDAAAVRELARRGGA